MVHLKFLLVAFLIPIVGSFNVLLAHRNGHVSESVRLLKANETAGSSGSDIVFSWAKCVICDGYEARLHLQNVNGKREIPYQLKSAVTALKVTNIPPRTVYKLVVKKLPSDASSSQVSGRTFSPNAPQAVENLVARVLTDSSIQIEWTSVSADGFVVLISENDTVLQEKVIPDFSNHSIVNITNLEPEKNYKVQVTAFYFPPAGKSTSVVSSVRVKTLPTVLPIPRLSWKFNSHLELSWKNPTYPTPVAHRVVCGEGSPSPVEVIVSGCTEIMTLPFANEGMCELETWFSIHERSRVSSRVQVVQTRLASTDIFRCSNAGDLPLESSVHFDFTNGKDTFAVNFSESHARDSYWVGDAEVSHLDRAV